MQIRYDGVKRQSQKIGLSVPMEQSRMCCPKFLHFPTHNFSYYLRLVPTYGLTNKKNESIKFV